MTTELLDTDERIPQVLRPTEKEGVTNWVDSRSRRG